MTPKVSICMITYNHGDFIAQAIESVVMQQTNFDCELVIGEDCSTDRTKEIVVRYQRKYSGKIKAILNKKNLGMNVNFAQTLKACGGQYVALLEGDDYWTSPLKLQKQVDFLDKHPDFAICFHNAKVLNQKTKKITQTFFSKNTKGIWTLEDLLEENFMPTLTCMFRNKLFREFPKWYYNAFPGDWPLHIFNAKHGKIAYLDEVMAVYRIHKDGATSGSDPVLNYERYIKTFENIKSYLPPKYNKIIEQTISGFYFELSRLHSEENRFKKAKNALMKLIKIPADLVALADKRKP